LSLIEPGDSTDKSFVANPKCNDWYKEVPTKRITLKKVVSVCVDMVKDFDGGKSGVLKK
jgi:hypothetical protein